MENTGWLFDLYAGQQGGVVLWLLADDGKRLRLEQPFPVTFYAAGRTDQLRAVWRYLESQPLSLHLAKEERRDLFSTDPVTVLAIQCSQPKDQPRLFQQLVHEFPDLTYYDADIPLPLRYAALYQVFPLVRCQIVADEANQIQQITVLDSPWELDPQPAPLRTLELEPDVDPARATPKHLRARFERFEYSLPLAPARSLLIGLRAILSRHDPDLLLTSWGDTWLLPHLLQLSQQTNLPLPLNREAGMGVAHRPERTYFSYGQVVYQGRQVHLFGRWHIDRYNAMLFHDYGMDGILELARVTGLPVQTVARVSPGSGISAMQIVTALRLGVLVPWHKQQAEKTKNLLDLLRSDQGGMVYQPTVGLHFNVAQIDFISMYPSIMVRFNISPETVGTSRVIAESAMKLGTPGEPQPPGLVPITLAPLLEKRLAIKERLATLPAWHPQQKAYQARTSAHKWLLVTCFGYLGYKNARFGRIEAHEAVTAYGREALLRAKEAAEDMGFSILHMYVDGLWVCRPDASAIADFQPLLDEIVERTGLPIALEGIYRWVAFLPSRVDKHVPVANRYFGVFQDGSFRVRGVEARRRDTPSFIAKVQAEMLVALAQANRDNPSSMPFAPILALLRRNLTALRLGRLPMESLLVSQKLSRGLDEFRTLSPVARAATQLLTIGKTTSPGERVRFIYTRGEPGVYAWNLPKPLDPACVDVDRYTELLVRAAANLLEPFGVKEPVLREWLFSNAAYFAPPGVLPLKLRSDLPLWHTAHLLPEGAQQARPG